MSKATRAAAIGICALAVLSAGQWVRAQQLVDAGVLRVVLGVLPNFTAAIAIPCVALGAWLEMRPTDASSAIRRRFVALNIASVAGLFAWEYLQRTASTLRFDPADLVATVAGAATAHFVIVRGLHLNEPRDGG